MSLNTAGPRTPKFPTHGFADWQLRLVDVTLVRTALDVGCGAGHMASALRARMPWTSSLTVVDLDPAAVHATVARVRGPWGGLASVDRLPFAAGSFGIVIANHLLASVPNLAASLGELRRVLSPDGVLLASAPSEHSAREFLDLHVAACRSAGLVEMADRAKLPRAALRFSLENGAESLRVAFGSVTVHERDDTLAFGAIEPAMILYTGGLHTRGAIGLESQQDVTELAETLRPHMQVLLERVLAAQGQIVISRRAGCFIARP